MKYKFTEIETRKLKLHPCHGLINDINNTGVGALKLILKQHGYLPINPLIVIKKAKDIYVIAGVKRFLAALDLGIKTVPVLYLDSADDLLIKKIMILDNLPFQRYSYLQRYFYALRIGTNREELMLMVGLKDRYFNELEVVVKSLLKQVVKGYTEITAKNISDQLETAITENLNPDMVMLWHGQVTVHDLYLKYKSLKKESNCIEKSDSKKNIKQPEDLNIKVSTPAEPHSLLRHPEGKTQVNLFTHPKTKDMQSYAPAEFAKLFLEQSTVQDLKILRNLIRKLLNVKNLKNTAVEETNGNLFPLHRQSS